MITALLTIDDISSKNTPAIVDYLNEKGITAIMFATGQNVERYWNEAIYALQHGMVVGNHSYSHPHFSELTLEAAIGEIERCEQVLNKLYADAGVERVYRPFRFPFGDKGGDNRDALQDYFRLSGFSKVEDRHLDYPWWKESRLCTDIDTFWTFDFCEYQIPWDNDFTIEDSFARMNNEHPAEGAALFREGNRHILLLHAHDETDALAPGYYRQFIDRMLDRGVIFDKHAFI